jgi:hypothetical protein
MSEQVTNICLVILVIPAAIVAIFDIRSRLQGGPVAARASRLRGVSILFTVLLIFFPTYVMLTGGTGAATPFIAYYGESGNLQVEGSKVNDPIGLPNHIGCPALTGIPVETGLAKVCGPDATLHYNSVGASSGGNCGFNVFAGVCIKKLPFGIGD